MKLAIEEHEALRLIAKNDGHWGWYQLERALTRAGIVVNVVDLVKKLETHGFVLIISNHPTPPTQRYSITPNGRVLLNEDP